MKVSQAIELLSKLNQDKEIVITWWEQEYLDFNGVKDSKDRDYAISLLEDVFDWSFTSQELQETLDEIINKELK